MGMRMASLIAVAPHVDLLDLVWNLFLFKQKPHLCEEPIIKSDAIMPNAAVSNRQSILG